MTKKSPRYPRQSLSRALEMARKIFEGAHQAQIDSDTAAKLIGYTNSRAGAAASALGALRQFGLLDGLRGDVSVSELAMRIIQPMDSEERAVAMREAAAKPEIFGRLLNQFGGRLPSADEPIRAFLIRQEGFSAGGANELIKSVRETMNELPEVEVVQPEGSDLDRSERGVSADSATTHSASPKDQLASSIPSAAAVGELITLPLGQSAKAELRLIGDITAVSYARLIRHLELLRDMAVEEAEQSTE